MTATIARSAAAILVGNELLSGATQDANLRELARVLHTLGIKLERVLVVPDEIETIARDVRDLSQSFDVVFTSGGVGPTHDDVTIAAVARAFDVDVAVDERLLRAISDHCVGTQTKFHERMARVPRGACTLVSEFSWPTIVMQNVWILPGIPGVFRQKLGVVRMYLRGAVTFSHRSVLCQSDELQLVASIEEAVRRFVTVSIGSYPAASAKDPNTRVTFDGTNHALVEQACAYFISLLPPDEVLGVESSLEPLRRQDSA